MVRIKAESYSYRHLRSGILDRCCVTELCDPHCRKSSSRRWRCGHYRCCNQYLVPGDRAETTSRVLWVGVPRRLSLDAHCSRLFGIIFVLGSSLGPIIGGSFTSHVTWRWCFYVSPRMMRDVKA